MSTKTSIKRIALVAAAALTLGGFSAVSASASITYSAAAPFSISVADSGVTGSSDTTAATATAGQVAGASNYVTILGGETLSAGVAMIQTSGAGSWLAATAVAAGSYTDNSSTGVAATKATKSTATVAGDTVKVYTPTVGTVTITVSKHVDNNNGSFTDTVLQTFTINVTAASVVGALSVANSTSYISDSATVVGYSTTTNVKARTITADSTVLALKTRAARATILITLKDTQATPAAMAAKILSATVSGQGLVDGTGAADNNTLDAAPARVASSLTDSTGNAIFQVWSDGTAGTGTITITYTDALGVTTTVATESITFYSTDPAALAVTQNLYVAPAGGGTLGSTADSAGTFATTSAITIKATDSNGNLVSGLTNSNFSAVSSDTTVLSNTISVAEETSAGLLGKGYYNVQINAASSAVSGKTATLTISSTLPSDATKKVTAAAVTFSIGGTVAKGTVTAAFDAPSYNSGAPLVLTFTAKDSSGNPVYDQTVATLLASGGVAFNYGTGISTTGVSYDFIKGVASLKSYAPLAGGAIVATGTWGATAPTLQAALTFKAESTVTSAGGDSLAYDAASAATDAANNAYEEAQNATQAASDALAAVKALAVQVKALIKIVNAIKAKLKA